MRSEWHRLILVAMISAVVSSVVATPRGQGAVATAGLVLGTGALPATCTANKQIWVRTTVTPGLYFCSATDTWTNVQTSSATPSFNTVTMDVANADWVNSRVSSTQFLLGATQASPIWIFGVKDASHGALRSEGTGTAGGGKLVCLSGDITGYCESFASGNYIVGNVGGFIRWEADGAFATSGQIRWPNNGTGIVARNAANGANITLLQVDAADILNLGSTNAGLTLKGTLGTLTLDTIVTPAVSGTRALCISTTGVITSATACSGT